MTNPAPPRLPRWVPIAVVAAAGLALALTAHRLDSTRPKEALGPLRDYKPIAVVAAVALLCGLIAQVKHYRDEREGLLGRAAQACIVLLGIVTLMTPVALIAMHSPSPPPAPPPASSVLPSLPPVTSTPTPTPSRLPPPGKASPGFTLFVEITLSTILVVVVATAIVAVVLFLLRLWRSQVFGTGQKAGQLPFGTLEDAEDLADAVDAATAALDRGEAREAVIACYLVMERGMKDAGVRRQTSDSPEELLLNAARAGFVRGTAGRRLTDLFREARFSAHDIDEAKRAAARDALVEIAADLREVMAERAARGEEAARLAAGRNATLTRAVAEDRQPTTASKRGTHR